MMEVNKMINWLMLFFCIVLLAFVLMTRFAFDNWLAADKAPGIDRIELSIPD